MAKRKGKKEKGVKSRTASSGSRKSPVAGDRRPIVLFWLGFAGIMALFYLLAVQPFYVEHIQEPVSAFFAKMGSVFLNILGQQTTASGMHISSPDYSLTIKKGCDAIAPVMLVVTGILLYPAGWRRKLTGIGMGVLALFGLNLVRIVSLYFIGVHAPAYFEFMHVEFWQVVFIGLAILYFFYWLSWVTNAAIHAQTA